MKTIEIDQSTKLQVIDCAVCAMPFAVPERVLGNLLANGNAFWCPVGHRLSLKGAGMKRLRDQLLAAEADAGARTVIDRLITLLGVWRQST